MISSFSSMLSSPSGIMDIFEGSMLTTFLRSTPTLPLGSNMFTFTVMLSLPRLITLPVTVSPFSMVKTDGAYWSLTTLLGSSMDSRRSRGLTFPAALVKSGPSAPPSPSNRWQENQAASPKTFLPLSKSLPFLSEVLSARCSSDADHSLTKLLAAMASKGDWMLGSASRMSFMATF